MQSHRWPTCLKRFSSIVETYGFSPVCIVNKEVLISRKILQRVTKKKTYNKWSMLSIKPLFVDKIYKYLISGYLFALVCLIVKTKFILILRVKMTLHEFVDGNEGEIQMKIFCRIRYTYILFSFGQYGSMHALVIVD